MFPNFNFSFSRQHSVLTFLFFLCITAGSGQLITVAAQSADRPDRGVKPATSYAVSDLETVNMNNGNVSLSIPMASLPPVAGGRLSWALTAHYNSKLWDATKTENIYNNGNIPPPSYVVSDPQMSDLGGWRIASKYSIIFHESREDFDWQPPQTNDPDYQLLTLHPSWYKVLLEDPDGARHELRPLDYQPFNGLRDHLRGYYDVTPNNLGGGMRYYSVDGSFLWALIYPLGNSIKFVIYQKDGTRVVQYGDGIQKIIDTNNNSIKIYETNDIGTGITTTHFQDELTGREIKYVYDPSGNGGYGRAEAQYQTVGGSWVSIEINFGFTQVRGKMYKVEDPLCVPTVEKILDNAELIVVRSIILPQTQPGLPRKQFTFSYNSDNTHSVTHQIHLICPGPTQPVVFTASNGWGEINQMNTPSGAKANYSYSLDTSDSVFEAGDITEETLKAKNLEHDGITDPWAYDIFYGTGGSVSGPDGMTYTEQSHYFSTVGLTGLTFRTNRSNKVIVERHWTFLQFNGSNAQNPGGLVTFNPVVDAEYTTLKEGVNAVKMSAKTFQYDFNGNVTQTTEYDWFDPALVTRDIYGVPTGVPASATVLRTTTNTYYNPATTAASINVYAKRAIATVTPLILNALQQAVTGPSQSQFSYDNQAYGVAPTVGNLTKASQWDDQNSKWLDTVSTYDGYGNLITTVSPKGVATTGDPNDFVTTFTWDSSTHATVTQVTADPRNGTGQQATTMASDYWTGRPLSQTDVNGQTVTTNYTNHLLGTVDPYMRPGLVTGPMVTSVVNGFPFTNQQNQVRTTYYDNLRQVTVESDLNTTGDRKLKTRTSVDELGRVKLTERNEDGTSSYSISSQVLYFQMGRITMASNPNRGTTAATDGWARTTRDEAGRVTEVATFATATPPPISGTNSNWTGSVTTAYNANEVIVADQNNKQRKSVTDAVGRLIQVNEAPNDSAYNYQTNYSYDVLGNLIRVRQGGFPTGNSPDPTVQFRRFYYDSLSRLVYANNPEQNATIAFNPPGEAGTMWTMKYVYDNNGNLTNRTDARGVLTTYGYDALNRNTTVDYFNGTVATAAVRRYYDVAGSEGGTFTNGKGRLRKVESLNTHPQSGQAAWSRTIINEYDNLGRVTSQRQGFLKSVNNWQDFGVTRSYDLASHMTSQNYPESGRAVSYAYGTNGWLSNFYGNLGDAPGFDTVYANQFEYSAAGQMTREQLGTGIPLFHHSKYNSRHQMVETSVGTGGSSAALSGVWDRGRLLFFYNTAAMEAGDPSVEGSGNNGNVLRQEHWVPTTVSPFTVGGNTINVVTQYAVPMRDDYFYDSVNRITQVQGWQRTTGTATPAQIYQQTYSYDKFGNRKLDATQTWGSGINGANATSDQLYGIDKLTNRLAAATYDRAGNLRADPGVSLKTQDRTYDAENRMTSAKLGSTTSYYGYDGDGRRVRRILSTGEFWQVYGIDGELLAEYQWNGSAATLKKEYGYRDGQLLVVADPTDPNANKRVQWLIADHLGTPRMVVDKTGSLSGVTRHDYLPFGEELMVGMGDGSIRSTAMGYVADTVRQKFTDKERDTETGLDYFLARYYSSTQGRFTSTDEFKGGAYEFGILGSGDPEKQALVYADITNPQSLNKYQYCFNNPLRYVDPNGQKPQDGGRGRAEERDVKLLGEGKITLEEFQKRQKERMVAEGVGAGVGLVIIGASYVGPRLITSLLLWASRNPDKVKTGVDTLVATADGNPMGAGSLTIAAKTRLRPEEITTGLRLAKQTGLQIVESAHIGEEFAAMVNGVRKTYDAIGTPKAYQYFGDGTKFFQSILHHVRKSVDHVVIDLKGAAKEQIGSIQKYVNGLPKEQRDKVIYLSP